MALRLGWFSTGRDRAAEELFRVIDSGIKDGSIDAELSFCFSNRGEGEDKASDSFLRTVREAGVPVVTFSSACFKPDLRAAGKTDPSALGQWRLEYDREVMSALKVFSADLIVLAGYMLIVGPEMCARYTMINLHPALPGGPTGTWQQVIEEILASGARRTGAMMHLVTPELDRGPAISYFSFPVRGGFDDIRQAGAARELPLILATVTEFAKGNLSIKNGQVYANDRVLAGGYDLTEKVETWLTENGSAYA